MCFEYFLNIKSYISKILGFNWVKKMCSLEFLEFFFFKDLTKVQRYCSNSKNMAKLEILLFIFNLFSVVTKVCFKAKF